MHQPESIEQLLSRLMPTAMSEEGQRSIEQMLDELAGEEEPSRETCIPPEKKRKPWLYLLPPIGIAAAATLAFFFPLEQNAPHGEISAMKPAVSSPGVLLLGEMDRVETFSDEGWLADPQGMAMQAVRVKVVEENTLRDEQTGIIFQVSEPREELILTPVVSF